MAVYTRVPDTELAALLARYDIGFGTVEPIAEGVENSNFHLRTDGGRFVLTLYEKRVAEADLPYFLALMEHTAARRVPAPAPVADRSGRVLQRVAGRPAAIVKHLPGAWPRSPTPAQASAAGRTLAAFHAATTDFAGVRPNALGPESWRPLADSCDGALDTIAPGLEAEVRAELLALEVAWPGTLPRATIHADLFPDNLLFEGNDVSGMIDFYFACTDLRAYDLAVMLGAWAFDATDTHRPEIEAALLQGYGGLPAGEAAALPVLARGAALRFLLTRAYDWLNTPAGAAVTRKDPLAYLARLRHFQHAA